MCSCTNEASKLVSQGLTIAFSVARLEGKDGRLVRALAWATEELSTLAHSATDFLCDLGGVT